MKNKTTASINYFWVLVCTTLGQLGLHTYLALHHVNLKLGLSEGPSICNINQSFNCDAVAASSYSEFLGLPIAFLGLAAQVFSLVMLISSHPILNEAGDKKSARYLFYFSFIIALASLVMGSISLFFVKALCLFCLFTYALSFIGLWASFKWAAAAQLSISTDFSELFFSSRSVLIGLIAVPLGAIALHSIIGTSLKQGAYGSYADTLFTESVNSWSSATPFNFDEAQGLKFQNGNSPVVMTIVEFADFKCPHCKMASTPLHSFTKSHGDVKLIFKPFPLDGICNKALPNSGDGSRCWLAAAPFCAEKLAQKGWEAHDYLFEKQSELSASFLLDGFVQTLSSELELEAAALKSCIESDEIKNLVLAMAREGADAKIEGTPAVFVNGKKLNQGQVIPILNSVYQSLKGK